MSIPNPDQLPEEQRLALAYTPTANRGRLRSFFAFDKRLAQIVSKTTEPILGQMRLAWWRDMLNTPISERPKGDEVLDALGQHWEGRENVLIQLVDVWEMLVAEEEMTGDVIQRFGRGRGAPFTAIDDLSRSAVVESVRLAGTCWALADAASHISKTEERAQFVKIALRNGQRTAALPRSLRGLAVLEGLAKHALEGGGEPLMQGRASALRALKVGLLGR